MIGWFRSASLLSFLLSLQCRCWNIRIFISYLILSYREYGIEYYHIILIVVSVESVRYCCRYSNYMTLIMEHTRYEHGELAPIIIIDNRSWSQHPCSVVILVATRLRVLVLVSHLPALFRW